MANIILALCLAIIAILFAVALTASALQSDRRAARAERRCSMLAQHLAGLGCRVVVEADEAGCEQVRFVWPEINDFILSNEPERIAVDGRATNKRAV